MELWEKVISLSEKIRKKIIPYKQDSQPLQTVLEVSLSTIEQIVLKKIMVQTRRWMRCILIIPTRILSKIPKRYELVWSASFEYYFTDKDLLYLFLIKSIIICADVIPVEEKM
jgi:hypothetical protein